MDIKDILLILGVMIIWGANYAIMKLGVSTISPFFFMCLRTLVTGAFVFIVPRPKCSWYLLIGMGLLTNILHNGLFLLSFKYGMTSGLASVLIQTHIIFTAFLGALFLKENPTARKWIGLGISFVGLLFIAYCREGNVTISGIALIIAASFFCAIGHLIVHKAIIPNMISFVVWSNLISVIPLFSLSLSLQGFDTIIHEIKNLSFRSSGTILYSSILAGIVGPVIMGRMLQKYQAYQVSTFSFSSPLFGILAAYILLNEKPSLLIIIGGIIILTGIMTTQIDKRLLVSLKNYFSKKI